MIFRISFLLVLGWLLGFALFSVTLPGPHGAQKTDAVVVLTGAGGRIERGLYVLEQQWAERMLISGVDRTVRPHELIAQYDMSEQLFSCCVDMGFRSVDTKSNANETAQWVTRRSAGSLRLVTTDWHMRRAHYELKRALPDDITIIDDAVPGSPRITTLFIEYNKYLARIVTGLFGF